MKKLVLLTLAAIVAFSVSVKAQNQNAPQEKKGDKKEERQAPSAEKRAEKMAKDLSLTEQEKIKVIELFKKQDAAIEQFKKETPKDSEDFRKKFRELRKSQDDELKAIIGDEKFQKLQTMREEQRKQRENGNK